MRLKEWLVGLLVRKEPKMKCRGVQWDVICRLRQNGSITAWEVQRMGTTAAHRLISRLRRFGYISHYIEEPNANGSGYHHRHYWSGK